MRERCGVERSVPISNGEGMMIDQDHLREVNLEGGEQGHGERSPCCCRKEIKSLKHTVKQLSVQIEKQSEAFQRKQDEMIAGMKACVRNVALALLTFSQENEEQVADGRYGNPEQAFGPAAVDTELLKNSEVAMSSDTQRAPIQDNLEDGEDVSPVTKFDAVPVPFIVASVSLETSSNEEAGKNENYTVDHVDGVEQNVDFQDNQDEIEAGPVFCQKFEQTETDINFKDVLGDNFYALDENEDEANQEKIDEENSCHGARSTTTTKIKRKGDFQKKRVHHKKKKQSAERSKCHLCTKDFSSPSDLKRHIRSVHEGVRYKCTKCPGTFSIKATVYKHEKTVHQIGGPPTQQCKICGIYLLKSKHSLINHMSSMHKGQGGGSHKKHECSKCPAKFNRIGLLQLHEKRIHMDGRPTQKCKICGIYLLDSKGSLRTHMTIKHNKSGYDPSAKRKKRKAALDT